MAGVAAVNPKKQFLLASGIPAVGGTVDVYLAGTTTRTTTWQDSSQATANTNPITLDARGECLLWLDDTLTYKFVLKDSAGVQQWSVDNIAGPLSSASLAASSGSSLVGDGDTTVADRLSAINLADYTALRAYTGASKRVYITGYLVSAAPSGIAGQFTRDDTDTTSADNGGTIIVASNGKRWKRVFSGPLSTRWFGAKSGAESTAALQAAIDALKVSGGGWLDFPEVDEYIISGTLTANGLSNAKLTGRALIKRTSSGTAATNTPALQMTSCSNVEVAGLRFYMSNSTTTSINLGVTLTSCSHLIFRDCDFSECAYGILASTGNSDVRVIGCTGTNSQHASASGSIATGGGAFIYGFGQMTRTYIGRCTSSGYNHLVLCDGDTDWTVEDCWMTGSGDSTIYIRGARHTVKNCSVTQAGKDGIKIVAYSDNTFGERNLITGCKVNGAGYTKSDGGNNILIEGNYSQVTDCEVELAGPTTASLAASAENGVTVGGKNVIVSNIAIKGPGVAATGGATTGVIVIGARQESSRVLIENVRAESLRYAYSISDTGTYDISDIEFHNVWAKTCDGLGYVNDADQRIKRVRINGGGVDGTTGHALDLGNLLSGVWINGVHFKGIASTKFCIVQRDGTWGRYTNCTTEGGPLPIANVSGGSTSRQIDNDWQYTSTGQPTLVSANFVGDQYWNSAPAAGGSPGSVCITAGNPGTFKNMAAVAA